MFNIYFKVYSEKVWGIDCVASVLNGSTADQWSFLAKAIRKRLFKMSGRKIPTSWMNFSIPTSYRRISERLRDGIEVLNEVMLNAAVEKIYIRMQR